ncbi:hypothetical protein H8N00_10605 [Streptomyces sp. AC563]|uniref:hypothetical protein n=1 Tax=Streptomyces buecherae TaxID=2763006 RepID=UPI00164DD443|nr:hypothetical protein [Streptomyces buecherae]MBC3989322.1 hypothetical protein [Streptomyces buecherae]
MSTVIGVAGTVASVLAAALAGWFSLRGSRAAARISTAPVAKQVDLTILQETTTRLDAECKELRQDLARVRGLLWSLSRWALRLRDQVADRDGIPEPPPADVDEYYRTGV